MNWPGLPFKDTHVGLGYFTQDARNGEAQVDNPINKYLIEVTVKAFMSSYFQQV